MKYYSVSISETISKEQLEEIIRIGYEEIYDKTLEDSEIKVYG